MCSETILTELLIYLSIIWGIIIVLATFAFVGLCKFEDFKGSLFFWVVLLALICGWSMLIASILKIMGA